MSQSAERALRLLLTVTESDEDLGLMEICARSGIDKSTATRLLGQLQTMRLVARWPQTKKYSIGPRMIAASAYALRRLELGTIVRPHLVSLRNETEETVTLHLRADGERVCIDGLESTHGVRRVVPLGERSSLVEGKAGRVMLARLDESERNALLSGSEFASVATSVQADIDRAIREDFLAGNGSTEGVVVVTTSLRLGAFGVGAIAVSGPASRWTIARAEAFGPKLVTTAAEIDSAFGF